MNKFEMAKLEIKASIEKANIELENATATLKDYMFLGLEVPKTLTNNIKELEESIKDLKDMLLDVCCTESETRIKPVPSAVYHNSVGNVIVEY